MPCGIFRIWSPDSPPGLLTEAIFQSLLQVYLILYFLCIQGTINKKNKFYQKLSIFVMKKKELKLIERKLFKNSFWTSKTDQGPSLFPHRSTSINALHKIWFFSWKFNLVLWSFIFWIKYRLSFSNLYYFLLSLFLHNFISLDLNDFAYRFHLSLSSYFLEFSLFFNLFLLYNLFVQVYNDW